MIIQPPASRSADWDLDQFKLNLNLLDSGDRWAADNSDYKILEIESQTLSASINFMQKEMFYKKFNSVSHLFFIVVRVHENDVELSHEVLKQLGSNIDKEKPLIMQWESPSSIQVYIKEAQGDKLMPLDLNAESSLLNEDALIDKISPEGSFKLPLLFDALKSGLGGRFKEGSPISLLEITFDANQEFDGWRLIDYAARDDDSLSLRFLLLNKWDLTHQNSYKQRTLEIAAQYAGEDSLLALLDLPLIRPKEELFLSSQSENLLKWTDSSGNTPLLTAAQNGKKENLEFLIQNGSDIYYRNNAYSGKKNALELAWTQKQYGSVVVLLKADFPFHKEFDLDTLGETEDTEVTELKTLVENRKKFHEFIFSGNLDEVDKFINDHYPLAKRSFNLENQSALSTALQANQYNIYAFLQSKGFSPSEKDDYSSDKLTDGQKKELKKSKEPYFKKPDASHITYLLSKTRLGLGQENNEGFFKTIKELYEDLDEIHEISTVLKVIEQTESVNIIFDFSKDSVTDLDPTHSSSTAGAYDYKAGRIYIGAKTKTADLLGTLAHELMHLSMQILYNNDCNPYKASDETKKSEFAKIVNQYKEKVEKAKAVEDSDKPLDPIIQRVFTVYKDPQLWPSELIVSVPHLLAKYGNEQGKQQLSQKAKHLLNYYTETINKDLLKFIQNPNLLKGKRLIRALNNRLEILYKIEKLGMRLKNERLLSTDLSSENRPVLLLETTSPCLSHLNVYQFFINKSGLSEVEDSCIFSSVESFKNQAVASNIFDAFQSGFCSQLIIECSIPLEEASLEGVFSTIHLFTEKKILFLLHPQMQFRN